MCPGFEVCGILYTASRGDEETGSEFQTGPDKQAPETTGPNSSSLPSILLPTMIQTSHWPKLANFRGEFLCLLTILPHLV